MIYSNDFHWQSSFRLPQNVFGGLGLSYRCQCFLATNRLVKPSLIEVSMKWLNCLGLRREGSSLVLRPRRQGWGGPSEKSYFRRCDRNFLDWSENHLEFLGESRNRGQNPIRTKSSARDVTFADVANSLRSLSLKWDDLKHRYLHVKRCRCF